MKLCVFQGTFNPIHNAHLRVAKYVVTHLDIDKVIFIPAFNPPHKTADVEFSKHRLKMVELAVQDEPLFGVSDIEYKRGGTSYTYLTIKELYEMYSIDGKINFIIGTDAFDRIESWYNIDELKKLVRFVVFLRDVDFDISCYDHLRTKGFDFVLQSLSFLDISSTELRGKISNGDDFSEYVNENVKDYILQHGLYKN